MWSRPGESPRGPAPVRVTPAVRAAFERYDADRSGAIDRDELQMALQELGLGKDLDTEATETILKRFDDNGDGILQLREFAGLVAE